MDMLQGRKLASRDGSLHPVKYALKNKKYIIYYFSASYINHPEMLQKLKILYQENLKRGTGMEVIYVSSDSDEKAFKWDFCIRQGPWLAIPFKDVTADELRYKYDITSLPVLIVVNREGDLITRKGKEELEKLGINVIVTWTEYVQQ